MSKRTKWLLSIGLIAVLVIGWQAAAFAVFDVASLSGSKFEIDNDANLKHDGDATYKDWVDLAHTGTNPPEIRATDKVNGTGDNSYAGGVKEDTVCPAQTTDSIPPNKSDLLSFHVYKEPGNASNSAGYINLAWSRVSEPSGTTLMDFEFNQNDPTNGACSSGPNVKRTAGDILIEYAIDQGGSRANISARKWTGNATSGSWGPTENLTTPSAKCPDGNTSNDGGGTVDLGPCAVGTINQSAILFGESDGLITSGQKDRFTFGEAQLDLRYIFQPNKCSSLGSAMLKSRSSDSFTSQLKDFVAPVGVNLTNCGKVIIRKNTVPDEQDQNFDYTKNFAQDTTPATATQLNFQLNDNDVDGNPKVPDTRTFNNVLFGSNYTVTENALPAGWKFDSLNCDASSTSVPAGDRVITDKTVTFKIDSADDILDCTYTNSRLTTTLGTAQSFIPQDTATVGGEPNSGFNGTVDFRLYTGSTCSGTLLYEELNRPLSGTTADSTATTTNDGTPSAQGALDGHTITGTGGTFSWKVKYEGDTASGTDTAAHPDMETCVRGVNTHDRQRQHALRHSQTCS